MRMASELPAATPVRFLLISALSWCRPGIPAANEKGACRPLPFRTAVRSVLPAIDAAPNPAPVELDQPLLPHRERRIQQRLLIELRERLLQPFHCQTFPTLAQHLRDGGLNRGRLARTRARRDADSRARAGR